MAPESWKRTELGRVADISIGKTPSRKNQTYWDPDKVTSNRWATIADLKSRHISDTSEYISDLGVQMSKSRIVPAGTLLMSFKLSIGRVAITSTALYTNEAIAAFYPTDQATPQYLYYLLPTLALESVADQAVKGRTLNKSKLVSLPVVLPPVEEQRRIAATLSCFDDTIEKTQAVIEQVQIVNQGITQELITHGLPGHHTRFKRSEIGEVPEDWAIARMEELSQPGRPAVKAGPFGSSLKKSFYVPSGYRVYGQEQVLAGNLSVGDYYVDETLFNSLKSCEVKAGDVLMSLVGTYGEAVIVPADAEPGIINPRLLRLSLDPTKVLPEFLCLWLHSIGTQRRLTNLAQGGTMGVLNAALVKALAFPLPALDEQAGIVAAVAAIQKRLDSELAVRSTLVNAKQALISALISGELRVTHHVETP